MKTLRYYVLRELAAPIVLSAAFFTIVLIIVRLFDVADMMLKAGVGGGVLLEFLVVVVGTLITLTIPMAVLLGTLIGVGRLTSENEILAIRSAGISLLHVFLPIVIGSLLLAFVLMGSNSFLMPGFVRHIDSLIFRIQFGILTNLKPGVFYDDLGPKDSDLTLYFESLNPDITPSATPALNMSGVSMRMKVQGNEIDPQDIDSMTEEERDAWKQRRKSGKDDQEFLIFAQTGTIEGADNGKEILLTLNNGTWIPLSDRESDVATIIRFDQLENILESNSEDIESTREVSPQELDTPDLAHQVFNPPTSDVYREESGEGLKITQAWRRHFSLRNELIQRFTMPLAVVAFVLIAIPLAIEIRPRAKSLSLLIAIGLIVGYYALFVMAGNVSANGAGWFTAILMYMLPNLIIGGIGCWMMKRALMR